MKVIFLQDVKGSGKNECADGPMPIYSPHLQ